jgi:hypothetical protein
MLNLGATSEVRAYKRDRRVFLSQIVEGEFNCSTQEFRLVSNLFYIGRNGTVEIRQTSKDDSWTDLKNGFEIWSYVWRQACK